MISSAAVSVADRVSEPVRSYSQITVEPLSPFVGAEIGNVDLSSELSDAVAEEIARAFREHGVVFFRDQVLTPEQHIALARRFGTIEINRFFKTVDGYPEIAEVRKEADQKSNIGGSWHTDHSYDQAPAKASLLYAREVPPVGGDTLFSSMVAAYDALSPGLKATLERLKAVHSSRHVFGYTSKGLMESDLKGRISNPELATQDALHPVVITHPETGRKALYVNANFTVRIDGWSSEESAALLGYLYRHAVRPEFTMRFRWRQGSLAFWDNRSTWHLALNDYSGHRRLLHRITLAGTPLS
ncbi:MAG: TauD/TfdA family dioxygenase [Bradyrhizobium sp.]|uniref:TauD/TfdA dioxygenase family protein n=1 Tax=Bradyrhizobium sp. TaxID=376 RepID=UPI001E0CCCC2|nr:TauD/TfdA family dioxygenase [Bradyrhizobium sp.]MBV9561622.1 TauD/TfdA family dioxygenase [Bradyrhizobium sp.]